MILVTRATGKVGRHILAGLLAEGAARSACSSSGPGEGAAPGPG
jgi:uncharacterized protein YbjT (DUF2867 family)